MRFSGRRWPNHEIKAMRKNAIPITITLGEKQHAQLPHLFRQYDVSRSWLTRRAVYELLGSHGRRGGQPVNLPIYSHTGVIQ